MYKRQAKGHLVREIDALGGLMGIAADATFLQSRMLNRGKGPAVHSLRVQTDRKRYHIWMKHALEKTANLDIHQGEICLLYTSKAFYFFLFFYIIMNPVFCKAII